MKMLGILIISLLILVQGVAHEKRMGLKLDPERLKSKLAKPTPAWVTNQIASDLAYYQDRGVYSEQLDQTLDAVKRQPSGSNALLVRFRIKNNKITMTGRYCPEGDERVDHAMEFIEEMGKHVQLPNIEFLASLWDCFDDPIFLDALECPVFTICKLRHNKRAVLWPETRQSNYKFNILKGAMHLTKEHPWESKKKKAYWRGISSGGFFTVENWDQKPRPRLVMFSQDHPHLVDARLTSSDYWTCPDVAKWMKENDYVDKWVYSLGQVHNRYMISVDGNSFASNLYWLLGLECTIIRERSDHIEWFHGAIKEGVHYVCYDTDCNDLAEVINYLRAHDDEAKRISDAATKFAKDNLTLEDIALYLYRLFEAYAALCHD